MPTSPLRTRLAALALGAALILPWSAAAEPARQGLSPRAERAAASPWSLLPRAWSLLVSLWAEEGCMIDPDGRCVHNQAAAPVPAEEVGIDPSGLCAVALESAERLDEGCMIDPSGHH